MNERGPIIVPLDGSELAEGALATATQIAHAERTHLVLFSAWEEPGSGTPPAISMEIEAGARHYFDKYLRSIRERLQQPEIRTIVRCGDPGDVILEVAEEVGARLIVVASHGRSGIGRWLYGSTTQRLLHESRLPVLVVGPEALARSDRPAVKHVMVPLDGSVLSELAIDAGVRLATLFGAKLSLVQAVRWAYETYPYAGQAMYLPALDSDLEAGALEYIQRRTARISSGLEVHGFVVRGFAAQALMDFEEAKDVDLVVMTTHARSGVVRAALGSTAERMVHGRAPVLLLRPSADAAEETSSPASETRLAAARS
jgi:nucleotide-binding universal stress UspA family protein